MATVTVTKTSPNGEVVSVETIPVPKRKKHVPDKVKDRVKVKEPAKESEGAG